MYEALYHRNILAHRNVGEYSGLEKYSHRPQPPGDKREQSAPPLCSSAFDMLVLLVAR
jgi:hypothetical protein